MLEGFDTLIYFENLYLNDEELFMTIQLCVSKFLIHECGIAYALIEIYEEIYESMGN